MWILWFTERRRRRRPPPRALSRSPCTFCCMMKLSGQHGNCCVNMCCASTLGTHRHSIIIHQRTRECLSQQNCIASLQNENATQAARQEHEEREIYYIYIRARRVGAPFCLHRTAHSARGCIVIDSSGSAAAALLHFVGFESLRPTATSMISMARFVILNVEINLSSKCNMRTWRAYSSNFPNFVCQIWKILYFLRHEIVIST